MCTMIVHQAKIDGRGKGARGWFEVKEANVSYDHPYDMPLEHALNIDFVHEMHAAPQVETETHRLQAEGAQKRRRARYARQRNDVLARGRIVDRVARPDLIVHVRKADDEAPLLQVGGGGSDLLSFEDARDALLRRLVHRGPILARQILEFLLQGP